MRKPISIARHVGAAAAAAALMMAVAAPRAPAGAETLFQDVTAAAGVDGFVPTINRDASPAVFPAFFKTVGEAFGFPGFCGADGTGGDPTALEPTCEFGQSAYIGGVLIADFNNDGRNDVFATNAGGGAHALFINQGNDGNGVATFADMAAAKGAAFPADQGSAAVAGDVNNDGWVDLYISNIGFDNATEFARTSFVFASLGNLTEAELAIANTGNQGLNRLLINKGSAGGVWQGFEEAASAAGAAGVASTRSTSPSMADFDNDGDLDIFVAAHTNVFLIPTPTNFPIFNPVSGAGALSRRVADVACFGDEEGIAGNILGDGVDQNGNCVPSGGSLLFKNMLKETGSLAFTDVTHLLRDAVDPATGVANVGGDGRPYIDSFMSFDGVWFDYDDNGYPDLVISNDADFVGVFRNIDGKSFEMVSRTALIDPDKDTGPFGDVGAVGAWMAISHGDVNGDGLIDFYATNAGAGGLAGTAFTQPRHALYINLGDGRFVDAAVEVDARSGAGFPVGVFGTSPDASLGHPAMDDSDDGVDNAETGAGHFAFGGQLFDMDNDGDLDIYNIGNLFGSGVGTRNAAANGGSLDPTLSRGFRVTNRGTLYENQGSTTRMNVGGQAIDVPDMAHLTETEAGRAHAGLDNPFDGRGLATGDLNGDGYVEVVTYNVSGNAADFFGGDAALIGSYHGGLRVFQNQGGSGNKALVLRLRGTKSNRSGFGARVTVRVEDDDDDDDKKDKKGKNKKDDDNDEDETDIVRELSSNTGHRGNASLELVIGVGDADEVDVTIDWPSGARQRLSDIELEGQRTCYTVVERDFRKGKSHRRSRGAGLKPCE